MDKETFALLKILPEGGTEGDEIPLGYGNIGSYKGQLIDIDATARERGGRTSRLSRDSGPPKARRS